MRRMCFLLLVLFMASAMVTYAQVQTQEGTSNCPRVKKELLTAAREAIARAVSDFDKGREPRNSDFALGEAAKVACLAGHISLTVESAQIFLSKEKPQEEMQKLLTKEEREYLMDMVSTDSVFFLEQNKLLKEEHRNRVIAAAKRLVDQYNKSGGQPNYDRHDTGVLDAYTIAFAAADVIVKLQAVEPPVGITQAFADSARNSAESILSEYNKSINVSSGSFSPRDIGVISTFQRAVSNQTSSTGNQTSSTGSATGFRVYLGTIPNYADSNDGLLLDGVRGDSPAAKAGLKAGDRIVKLAGREVRNVSDYTYALGEMKAGQEYEVEVMRGSQRLTLKLTPAAQK